MSYSQYRSGVRLNAVSSTGFINQGFNRNSSRWTFSRLIPSRNDILSTLLILSFIINLYFFLLNKDILTKLAISELNSQKQDISCEKQVSLQKLDIKENELAVFKETMISHDAEKAKLLQIADDQKIQLQILNEKILEEKNERKIMEQKHMAEMRYQDNIDGINRPPPQVLDMESEVDRNEKDVDYENHESEFAVASNGQFSMQEKVGKVEEQENPSEIKESDNDYENQSQDEIKEKNAYDSHYDDKEADQSYSNINVAQLISSDSNQNDQYSIVHEIPEQADEIQEYGNQPVIEEQPNYQEDQSKEGNLQVKNFEGEAEEMKTNNYSDVNVDESQNQEIENFDYQASVNFQPVKEANEETYNLQQEQSIGEPSMVQQENSNEQQQEQFENSVYQPENLQPENLETGVLQQEPYIEEPTMVQQENPGELQQDQSVLVPVQEILPENSIEEQPLEQAQNIAMESQQIQDDIQVISSENNGIENDPGSESAEDNQNPLAAFYDNY